jgi:Phage integrase family
LGGPFGRQGIGAGYGDSRACDVSLVAGLRGGRWPGDGERGCERTGTERRPYASGRPGALRDRTAPSGKRVHGTLRRACPDARPGWSAVGELAGLRVGDRVFVPGRGLRVQRAVLASRGGGELYVDGLKNNRARTVPLVPDLVPIVDRWAADRPADAWMFPAPEGGPLRESNWKRSVDWPAAREAIGVRTLRVHDLRHTAASIWLAYGADPKVVQRVLGHATATMTMDLYGHLLDASLWLAADKIGDISGTFSNVPGTMRMPPATGSALTCGSGGSRLRESNPGPTHYEGAARTPRALYQHRRDTTPHSSP